MYTGTARKNRIGKPHLKETSEMNKQSRKRGDIDFQSLDGILALKWIDNKVATILSCGAGVEPMSAVSRYDKQLNSKKDVSCQNVIKCYNSNMGVVDKSDMLVHLYKTPLRAGCWYIRILDRCVYAMHAHICVYAIDMCDMCVCTIHTKCYKTRYVCRYVIDMCVCNAWLLHKRLCVSLKETLMPLRKF